MEELKPELLILKAAAQEMRESRRLKDLLGVSCDRNCDSAVFVASLTSRGVIRSSSPLATL